MSGTAHEGRRARLRALLAEAEVDALLVTSLVNVRYLTGFTGSAGSLLVASEPDGDRFVTDGRYRTQAEAQVGDLALVVTRGDDWLPEALGAVRRLGLEGHVVSWDDARRLGTLLASVEVRPASGLVERLRLVKDVEEIAAVRRACAIGDAAFADLRTWVRPGLDERAVARRLEHTMLELGADAPAFTSIVASGPNAALPHHRPGDRVLVAGDLVKLDFGARLDGYHADMTRMVALGDDVDPLLREVVDVVRTAQQAGLDALVAGVDGAWVDAACREVIAEAGYGEAFPHGTGHGVGLEIHEAPRVAPGASATLPEGAVVTVEPGVYLPGRGGVRIEDTVVVTAGPPTVLTMTPKDLAAV